MRIYSKLLLALIIFAPFCFAQDDLDSAKPVSEIRAEQRLVLGIENAPERTIILGAEDPNTEDPEEGFKLQLVLSTKGASIKQAVFSNGQGKGFDDLDPKDPKPLVLLNPVKTDAGEILSMANNEFVFIDHKLQLRLNQLNWQFLGVETTPNGCQTAAFTAVINNQQTGEPLMKLVKTYALPRRSYMASCSLTVENLSDEQHNIRFNMTGLAGLNREDDRSDMRKIIAAFRNEQGQFSSSFIDLKIFRRAKTEEALRLKSNSHSHIWTAAVNKYFAAIAVPVIEDYNESNWIAGTYAKFYNPDGDSKFHSGDETLGFQIKSSPVNLQAAQTQKFDMELYLGPKDKSLFDRVEHYRKLGFYLTMDFITCCCPAGVIQPLAFFIIWIMNLIYSGIPNYGVVIIILVFLVRLILHPITKMGQIRMNRFTKLMSSPEIVEIRKKHGKNQMEMQKHISAFYKEKGVSPAEPIFGMLPMLIQMPIWIALWSAVNASIDLRGAGFLPFWITDLSSPDALFRFPEFDVPIIGKLGSFNLLPILMGFAFYVQQKLTPMQAAATPEQAQQQKIMQVMLLVMFPLMLYSAPSGVNLYIMSSVFGGALEQYVIKKHIKEKEQAESQQFIDVTTKTGGKAKKKKPKPFFKNY
ncbi:MAG: YidC/Oxa1 family insertase periplasmic-domain containing protein [Phycisphaerae bacterium]